MPVLHYPYPGKSKCMSASMADSVRRNPPISSSTMQRQWCRMQQSANISTCVFLLAWNAIEPAGWTFRPAHNLSGFTLSVSCAPIPGRAALGGIRRCGTLQSRHRHIAFAATPRGSFAANPVHQAGFCRIEPCRTALISAFSTCEMEPGIPLGFPWFRSLVRRVFGNWTEFSQSADT